MGLASGVPAALLLERRAALEGLSERLDAVRAREIREETAVELARRAHGSAKEAADEAAAAERRARIAAEGGERDLKGLRRRARDLDEVTARDRRALEGLAAERAEAGAEIETAGESAAAALLQAERLRPRSRRPSLGWRRQRPRTPKHCRWSPGVG